jgi:cell division protein FtsQ
VKKFKKIALITFWCLLGIGLVLTMGFVNHEQEALLCSSLDVKVNQDNDLYFLDKIDVEKLIHDRGDAIQGEPKSEINVTEIEKALNSHEDIANAEVYVTIDGKVKVEVQQRRPIIRLFNSNGESYYLDETGRPMPLSDKYTAKVLIANGNIVEPFASRYMYNMKDISKDTLLKKSSKLDELFAMANYINADEFWKAQIQQIYINNDKEMELVPTAGDQRIIFGDTTDMDAKFKKLMTFYQQGLNTTGWWDKYSIINLKFSDQIVCTKK